MDKYLVIVVVVLLPLYYHVIVIVIIIIVVVIIIVVIIDNPKLMHNDNNENVVEGIIFTLSFCHRQTSVLGPSTKTRSITKFRKCPFFWKTLKCINICRFGTEIS